MRYLVFVLSQNFSGTGENVRARLIYTRAYTTESIKATPPPGITSNYAANFFLFAAAPLPAPTLRNTPLPSTPCHYYIASISPVPTPEP